MNYRLIGALCALTTLGCSALGVSPNVSPLYSGPDLQVLPNKSIVPYVGAGASPEVTRLVSEGANPAIAVDPVLDLHIGLVWSGSVLSISLSAQKAWELGRDARLPVLSPAGVTILTGISIAIPSLPARLESR